MLRFAVLRGLAAVERFAAARFGAALLRDAVALADLARVAAFRAGAFLRAVVLPAAARDGAAVVADASTVHLPESRRCAASATASAISEPSFVALAATLLAACCAVHREFCAARRGWR